MRIPSVIVHPAACEEPGFTTSFLGKLMFLLSILRIYAQFKSTLSYHIAYPILLTISEHIRHIHTPIISPELLK